MTAPSEEVDGFAFLAFPEEGGCRRDEGDEAVDKAPAVVSSSSSSSVAPASSSSSASSSIKVIDSVGFGDPIVSNADWETQEDSKKLMKTSELVGHIIPR